MPAKNVLENFIGAGRRIRPARNDRLNRPI